MFRHITITDGVGEPAERERAGVMGCIRAAIRKLDHELGIRGLCVADFAYVTRIMYSAVYDREWGENEGGFDEFVGGVVLEVVL